MKSLNIKGEITLFEDGFAWLHLTPKQARILFENTTLEICRLHGDSTETIVMEVSEILDNEVYGVSMQAIMESAKQKPMQMVLNQTFVFN